MRQFPNHHFIRQWIFIVLTLLSLNACGNSPPKFNGSDISDTHLGQNLSLTDHNGQARTLNDFKDKIKIIFFGFTQCPDICPTALTELSQVLKQLGAQAAEVQVLMITVDPTHDTALLLKEYLTAFNPSFLGLTGSPEQIKDTAASFKAYYSKSATAQEPYNIDHTAAFYLVDRTGQARVLISMNQNTQAIVHDVHALLNETK